MQSKTITIANSALKTQRIKVAGKKPENVVSQFCKIFFPFILKKF